MKKLVALLLCTSFVAGMAACTKETEETKKKKKKKATTEETEETTTEPDDPSETEETDTTTTEDTEPSQTDPDSGSLVYDNTLNHISLLNFPYDIVYGMEDPALEEMYGMPMTSSVHEHVECLYNLEGDLPELDNVLMSVYTPLQAKYDSEYQDALKEFLDAVDNGTEINGKNISCITKVSRADDLICSFDIMEYGDGDVFYIHTGYNYFTETGVEIHFDDVVKDKDALLDLVEKSTASDPEYYRYFYGIENLQKAFEDDTIQMTLTYDGVYLYAPNMYSPVKISAIGHEDIFDMSYFGAAPMNIGLQVDMEHKIYWDVDGDGKTDEISFSPESYDDYDFAPLTISVNGIENVITGDMDNRLYGYFETAYYFQAGKDRYLVVNTIIEDDYDCQLLFQLNTDFSVEFLEDYFLSFDGVPYDPEYINMNTLSDFVGTSYDDAEYTLLDTNGELLLAYPIIIRNGGALIIEKTVKGMLWDGISDVEEKEIPAGSSVRVYGYDVEMNEVYLEVLFPDFNQNYIVKVPCVCSGYPGEVDGIKVTDLFIGLRYFG